MEARKVTRYCLEMALSWEGGSEPGQDRVTGSEAQETPLRDSGFISIPTTTGVIP